MAWSPTRAQFFLLGLPPESCTALARTLEAVDAAADTFELVGHGFEEADLMRFRAEGDGAALPAGLSSSLLYEAVPVGDSLFQARAVGGAVVNITDAGAGVITVTADYLLKLDRVLYTMARWVDDHATPYDVASDTFVPPPSFEKCACELAALKVATTFRAASPSYSIEDVRKTAEDAQAFLDKLRSGKPLAVTPVDATPGRAELGARAFSRRPPRGFRRDAL